ncbi:hypothetical protein CPB85DRAFT_1377345 [Mucidula mucida]|nr:hypothetical protein CPB85DRAFT_1377345 [Mucidula mucida]
MATIRANPLPKSYVAPDAPAFLNHLRLTIHHEGSFTKHDDYMSKERERLEQLASSSANVEDDLGVGDEPETEEILSLDPKEWKKQDHYAVLGLSHLRFTATPAQIKVAHRKKVLKHHPDKKAHEVLTNPEKRRQFDSADPQLLEDIEDVSSLKSKTKDLKESKFIETFAPIFELEARFSKKQPVPMLGDIDASKQHVEEFYDFWYNFDSWRSFEWYDKEVNEGSDSRDDKRYTEKKNKSERARRKKEDIARLRGIVDLTLSLDPRIKRIKQEEKAAREQKKLAKSQPASGANTPKGKSKAEEEAEKLKKEEEEKVAKAEAKKQKAAAANAAKKARRAQRAEGA